MLELKSYRPSWMLFQAIWAHYAHLFSVECRNSAFYFQKPIQSMFPDSFISLIPIVILANGTQEVRKYSFRYLQLRIARTKQHELGVGGWVDPICGDTDPTTRLAMYSSIYQLPTLHAYYLPAESRFIACANVLYHSKRYGKVAHINNDKDRANSRKRSYAKCGTDNFIQISIEIPSGRQSSQKLEWWVHDGMSREIFSFQIQVFGSFHQVVSIKLWCSFFLFFERPGRQVYYTWTQL